jgi:aminoglycoside 6'-N-acetyltransferase
MTLTLRPALLADVPTLERWDVEPHVISAVTDDPNAAEAFGEHDWREELAAQSDVSYFLIAEQDGRPIGAMQVIDPHLEPTHYWGEIEPNLRALDIWIGEPDCLGRGLGTLMMREALALCFAAPEVTAVLIDPLASNTRAHRFYQRLGFRFVQRRRFGDDDCFVYRLERQDWRQGA